MSWSSVQSSGEQIWDLEIGWRWFEVCRVVAKFVVINQCFDEGVSEVVLLWCQFIFSWYIAVACMKVKGEFRLYIANQCHVYTLFLLDLVFWWLCSDIQSQILMIGVL